VLSSWQVASRAQSPTRASDTNVSNRFYSDDGDICTGEEALEGVAASWAYKEGDSVRLELEFTTGEDRGVLKFYKNGALIPQHFTGVEGPVIAAVLMSDCQEGDCIELVDLQYDPGQDTGEEAVQDLTEVLHQQRPVFTVMDAFASSCRAHLQYMSFREEDSKTTISAAKKALTRAIVKLQKATDKMRSSKCNSKKMELSSELKSDFLGRARAKIAEAEALVEEGKLTQSFKVFDDAIALVQKIEESGMLKEAKKARLAAVARRDLSFRNADRMMKLVRTKVASEVMATFLEGFEESVKMAAESALLFAEAGESTKATDAEITKVACEDLQRASQLANAANKSLENARITGVKHHFQKANDAFAQAAVLCTKNGCRALADMLKQLAFEAMEAFQAVEAADVESPVGMEDEDMEKAAQEYANMLDGKADEEEPDAGGSVEPCLTGVVSRRVMAPSKVFSVYVSSSIRENEPERLCLVRDVARMVRDAVVNFGFEFEFVDPFFSLFNAPEFASNFTFRARCNDVLKQCQAESAGVDFLCLMGEDDNGISFPGSIDFDIFGSVISRIPDRGELGKLRKVIIEWFKLDTNSNPRKYVILDRRKKIPNLSSIDAKKKAIGQQEWERQYAQLQKGFYEAINFQIAAMQMQKIRTGILHKLGKIDSVNMKKKCYELFCEIDVDGSGQIDVEELQTAFEQLEVKLTKDETRAFMDEFDEDRSGEIGFDEFLMIVEKLLLDAKNHEKEEPIKNVDHAKYFKESLMYQDLCDGILDRTRDVALERSVAVMWGFDPMQMGQELKYVEQGDEFDVQDSMAHLRKAQIDKKGGSDAVQKLEGVRPEWFQHIKCWQSKELAFKRLVDMEEYVEENPPDDSIAPDTPGSRGSSVLLLNVEPTVSNFEPKTPPPRELMGTFPPPPTGDLRQDGSPSREDTAKDKFGGRQIDLDAWEAMSCRKSIFLKTLSDWEFMRVVSRSKRKSFRGSTDSPFLVVQPLENHWSGSEEDIAKARDTIKRMEDKITRLTDQERRERNAMAKAKMQAEIKACEETIQCSQADVDRTMFVVLKGELEVILIEEAKSEPSSRSGSRAGSRTGSRPKTVEKKEPIKTKLAVLKRGDAFGDLTLVLGMGRDTMIQAVTPVDLALIRYDMVESLLIRNPDIQSRIMAVVNSMPPGSLNLQTHLLTRAIAPDYPTTRAIGVAMSTNKSPMVKVLTGKEVERLSKTVSTVNLPEGIQLFRQDDGQETGWGPFGDSAFLVLEGELRVEITFEDGDKQGKPAEVARIMEAGETVGEMNLVTGAPRTCTITTATACVLVEITRHQLSSTVHRDIRNDLMLYLAQPTNGNIEARILSQRTKHAMGLRQSTFLKQLSDIEIDFLAAVSKIRIEDKGACIVKQGEWGDSAFVVLRGQLRHMVAFAEGENVREVGRLKGADVFGETTLLLDYPRSSTVEVLSKTAMLAEISREAAEKMLNCRSDIVDTMEMMLHGDEGMQDIMRARTPLGGRAATPGGVVATGLKASISVVTYPWKAEANGMHAEMRGQSYIRAFAQKVANALFQRIEPALEKDHRALNDAKLPLLQECSFHLDIAARKTEVFAGRKDEMRRLVDYIEGEYQQRMGLKNQPTIVMGEAGVGKSALLANAGIKAKARNPGTICVFRFMGWSQESLNVRRMMKSILTQLMTTFGMKLPTFPDSLPELRDMLSSMLEKASKQELITLILDAVDDLETPAGFMPSFEWLPLRLPQYSSIILSLKPSSVDCVNMLNNLFTGEVYFNIYALRPVDAQPVLDGYLDKRGKPGFSNLHFETIRKASLESAGLEGVPMNCSPLFLNLCMNLSEDWISFNQCPALPDNIPDLVKLVCESLELEHGNVLIARSLSYLYTSREGLVWQELYDLLSCDDDVLEEVYKPQVPAYRRLPSFTGKLLANSLGKLLEPRFNNQVPTQKFRYRLFKHVVFERYELENTVRQCSIHRAMANYFSGEWADGKEITHLETHQWKASKDDGNKYTRGINAQSTFMEGVSRLIFHRRKRVANMRKIRELPHHICWSSGRSTKTIDPVGRALSQRPPSSWNSRHESDRNAQVMFQKHFCRLDIVEAACLAGYAFELHDDMLLAKKIFPYSELVRQFHKLVHEAIVTLAGNGHLTFQCALNSAGNGQGLINEVAHNMLQHYYAEGDRDGIPDVWFVHTNKDEVRDNLKHPCHVFFYL
jgi:CRP-like cAMP-binding protein